MKRQIEINLFSGKPQTHTTVIATFATYKYSHKSSWHEVYSPKLINHDNRTYQTSMTTKLDQCLGAKLRLLYSKAGLMFADLIGFSVS